MAAFHSRRHSKAIRHFLSICQQRKADDNFPFVASAALPIWLLVRHHSNNEAARGGVAFFMAYYDAFEVREWQQQL